MGNGPIYNGGENENLEIQFMARKIYQYGSTVHQKMQNSNILGVMFSKKKLLFIIFMRKSWFMIFEITMKLHCNLKNNKSWFSFKNIDKTTFCRKPNPQMLLFCIFWYTVDSYWYIFWPKIKFQTFYFSPIIKSMFSLYNLNKNPAYKQHLALLYMSDQGVPILHHQSETIPWVVSIP